MEIFFEGRYISSIKTNIKSKYILDRKFRFHNLLKKISEEFIEEQFYNGDKLLEYAKEKNIEVGDRYILLPHNKGNALVILSHYAIRGSKTIIQVKPFITVSTSNFINGWTYDTGSFSDVYCITDGYGLDTILFSCRDTLIEHNLYIVWVLERFEKEFLKEVDSENDRLQGPILYNPYTDELFNELIPQIENSLNVNKSINIDRLTIDGKSLKEYMKENKIFRYTNSDQDIFKICLKLGKPYKQVRSYIEKHA